MSTMTPTEKPGRVALFRRRSSREPVPEHIRPDGSRDVELPLREHLIELRNRLIKAVLAVVITTGLSLAFAQQEVQVLIRLAYPHKLIALSPTETFVSYLKVAFYTGLAISMPLLVYQLFRFLAPGLTRNERRWVLTSLPAVAVFFIAGLAFCYLIVLPSALNFLLNFGDIENTPTISAFL